MPPGGRCRTTTNGTISTRPSARCAEEHVLVEIVLIRAARRPLHRSDTRQIRRIGTQQRHECEDEIQQLAQTRPDRADVLFAGQRLEQVWADGASRHETPSEIANVGIAHGPWMPDARGVRKKIASRRNARPDRQKTAPEQSLQFRRRCEEDAGEIRDNPAAARPGLPPPGSKPSRKIPPRGRTIGRPVRAACR